MNNTTTTTTTTANTTANTATTATINTQNNSSYIKNSPWPSFTNNMTEDDIALKFDFDDEQVQFSYKEIKYLKKNVKYMVI